MEKNESDYVERMNNEFDELTGKIGKLELFLENNGETLPELKRKLMISQKYAMLNYASLLGLRLDLEESENLFSRRLKGGCK
ncbi:MAG: hypothetical protein II811_06885 [Spirochaetaceae bacterium]|nr:hypothetical protein [Spirochaetaceae bacterium]